MDLKIECQQTVPKFASTIPVRPGQRYDNSYRYVPVFLYGRIVFVYCARNFQPLKNRLYMNCYKGIRISVAVVGAQGCQNSFDPECIVLSMYFMFNCTVR